MSQSKAIRVVIVDNTDSVRYGLSLALESYEDIQVVGEASDGLQAIQQCQELCPDVVVMDIVMPNMSGIEASRVIRRQYPQTQIILLSSFIDDFPKADLQQVDARFMFSKGVSLDQLYSAIRSAHADAPTVTDCKKLAES